jgi:hypothetical protein
MLVFPEREFWTTFTLLDCGHEDYRVCDCPLGGHAMVSQGRHHSPISLTYGWGGEFYYYEIALIPSSSLISMAEEPSEVAHAKTEQDAVNIANESTGGEGDIISDIAKGVFGIGNVVLFSYGRIPQVELDQHDEAQEFLKHKTRELIQ